MTQTTATRTAEQAYHEHRDAIIDLLDELRGDIGMHNRDFDLTGRRNYGYVGDLAHVHDLLQQVSNFLNNKEEI
jgi:hypothetical protein